MVDETPEFSVKPLEEEEKPKRRAPRKAAAPRKRAAKTPLTDDKTMERHLDAIYKDENGEIPDMKKIEVKKGGKFFRRVFAFLIMLGLLAAAAWAAFFMMPSAKNGTPDQVTLMVTGDDELQMGATSTVAIAYVNNQNVNLNNVVLSVRYPANFTILNASVPASNQNQTEWQLDNLRAGDEGEIVLTGKAYGAPGTTQDWRIFLNYQPDNFKSELQTMATFASKIVGSPYQLKLSGPDKVVAGKDVNFSATVTNADGAWMKKLTVAPTFPANFRLNSSTPAINKTYWAVTPTSDTSTEYVINFRGQFANSDETLAKIKLAIVWTDENNNQFTIAENEFGAEVVKNTLNATLAVNGATEKVMSFPGDMLNTTIALKNNGEGDMTKITAVIKFDMPSVGKTSVMDWGNVEEKNDGDIKGTQISDTMRRGEIVWNGVKIPDLKKLSPNQEVSWDLQLPVKDIKSASWEEVKEFGGKTYAEITFTDGSGVTQTITSNQIEVTFNSDLKVETRDEVKTNAAGQKEHNLSWVVTNNFHSLTNLTLTADVYGDVIVKMPDKAPAGQATYDSINKKITWTVDKMTTATDVLALPFTITITKDNPTQNVLVSKVRVQALDDVTGQQLNLMANEVGLTQ